MIIKGILASLLEGSWDFVNMRISTLTGLLCYYKSIYLTDDPSY